MSITSTLSTTRRGYVSKEEVAEYNGIEVSAIDLDLLNKSEELIDNFVGYHKKFIENKVTGRVSAAGSSNFSLQSDQANSFFKDYFVLCEVEIIGGTGAGQRRKITGSTAEGVLTVDTAWATALDTTSFYSIYQLGKFPRPIDVICYTTTPPSTYYKQIPEAIKRAVCAQYEYMVELGASFFAGGGDNKKSETIGDYSYTNADGDVTTEDMVSTKVQALLGGFINRTGKIIV